MAFSIFLIALILVLGQVFSSLFEKTRVPDVLPLMLLGFILGPVSKVVMPGALGSVDGVFTEIVLIVILLFVADNMVLADPFYMLAVVIGFVTISRILVLIRIAMPRRCEVELKRLCCKSLP